MCGWESVCMCVCVYVCERVGEREKEGEREIKLCDYEVFIIKRKGLI